MEIPRMKMVSAGIATIVIIGSIIIWSQYQSQPKPADTETKPASTTKTITSDGLASEQTNTSTSSATSTSDQENTTITDNNQYEAVTPEQATHIEIIESCGTDYAGDCLNVRSGPSTSSPVVSRVRNNQVLKVATTTRSDGRLWYKTEFAEWLRYPDRVSGEWWIAEDFVRPLQAEGAETSQPNNASTSKEIIIDLSEQMLFAYNEDKTTFMEQAVSTGKPLYPTPRGRFPIFKMTPTRYMQGPIEGITDQKYDLPGVPWNLYFTYQGAVIHGAYWHTNFGQVWSNGCVNLPPAEAEKLYRWAELGTEVVVRD